MADNQFDKYESPVRVNQTRSSPKQDVVPKKPDENNTGKPAKPPQNS